MARNKEIDLNNWVRVEEMPKYDGMKLTLQTPEGGEPLPPLFYINKKKQDLIKDTKDVVWHKNIKIDMYVEQEQYNRLISWWFTEMMKEDEFKTTLNNIAKNATNHAIPLPLPKVIKKAEEFIKTVPKSKRYSHIGKYLTNRVTNLTKWWLEWSDAKKKYELNNTYKDV